MIINRGFRPKPRLTFCLNTKSKQKSQDCARFTRKTYAQLAETVQTRSFVAQTGQFPAPTSLVFRLTGRGQSFVNINIVQLVKYFIIMYLKYKHIYN